MAKPLTSWLVPSFLQHNLPRVVMGRCLHVSVTKFQDKFTSLRQVNSPSSWEGFQICCTDMYLIRFVPNLWYFACFCEFCGSATARNIRSPDDKLRHFHDTNWRLKIWIWRLYFSSWSPKGDLRIFLISSPAHVHTHLLKQLSLISQGKTYFNRLNAQLRWRTCS